MQVGIIGTAVVEILVGLLIMRIGKAALDKALPPVITGSVAIVIGIALAGALLGGRIREAYGRRMELLGGLVLIFIGIRILLEHYGAI